MRALDAQPTRVGQREVLPDVRLAVLEAKHVGRTQQSGVVGVPLGSDEEICILFQIDLHDGLFFFFFLSVDYSLFSLSL